MGGIQVLTAIAKINQAIDTGNVGMTLQCLVNPDAHVMGADQDCQDKYFKQLSSTKHGKKRVSTKGTTEGR